MLIWPTQLLSKAKPLFRIAVLAITLLHDLGTKQVRKSPCLPTVLLVIESFIRKPPQVLRVDLKNMKTTSIAFSLHEPLDMALVLEHATILVNLSVLNYGPITPEETKHHTST